MAGLPVGLPGSSRKGEANLARTKSSGVLGVRSGPSLTMLMPFVVRVTGVCEVTAFCP